MLSVEQKDKKYVWHPFTQMKDWLAEPQLVIEKAEGIQLIDSSGRRYYDGVSSLWVNLHGHRKQAIDQAIITQLTKVAHTSLLGLINVPAALLAEQLIRLAPEGLEKVFFSDDGSTAVEVAIKMAFQYWHLQGCGTKRKFVTLANAYHGDTIGTVSVGGIDLFHRIFSTLLFEAVHAPSPSCYHCKLVTDKKNCGRLCIKAIETMLADGHQEIAAVVVEPMLQAAAGMLVQPDGYLAELRKLTESYNVLLIVDEVATGFGRTGKMFACEHEGVKPDMMTVAKGITGGYLPLAATLTTNAIYKAFLGEYNEQKTFYHGHSYTGNPLACAAGLANLQIFEEEKVLAGLPPKIAAMRDKLSSIAGMGHVGDVRQCGLMAGIELVASVQDGKPYKLEQAIGARVCRSARKKGLIIRPLGDVIVFMPPLASTVTEIITMLEIIESSILEVTAEASNVPENHFAYISL